MLTVLRSGPYRFFLYAGDRYEPPHVHVERDDCEAKFRRQGSLLLPLQSSQTLHALASASDGDKPPESPMLVKQPFQPSLEWRSALTAYGSRAHRDRGTNKLWDAASGQAAIGSVELRQLHA